MIFLSKIKKSCDCCVSNCFGFFNTLNTLIFFILLSFSSCGEPEIKLTRADRKAIDTLVNHQLDSISPILDSLCRERSGELVQKAVDSIILERKKKEERLRLQIPKN